MMGKYIRVYIERVRRKGPIGDVYIGPFNKGRNASLAFGALSRILAVQIPPGISCLPLREG